MKSISKKKFTRLISYDSFFFILRTFFAVTIAFYGLMKVYSIVSINVGLIAKERLESVKLRSTIASDEINGMLIRWGNLIADKNILLINACSLDFITYGHDKRKEFTNHSVVDAAGNVVCSTMANTQPFSVADRDYFKEVLRTKKPVTSEFLSGRATGKPVIIYAAPILKNNDVIGVTIAGLSVEWFDSSLKNFNLPADSRLIITDVNGTVLGMYPDQKDMIGKKIFEPQTLSIILAGKEGAIEKKDSNGVKRVYSYMPLSSDSDNKPTSFVILGYTKDAVLNPLISLGLTLILLAALVIAVEFYLEKYIFNYNRRANN